MTVLSTEEGNEREVPPGALGALRDLLDGAAPVIGYLTVVEAHLLAGLAYRELGDQRAANGAAERALALAEADRLMLPFARTDARELSVSVNTVSTQLRRIYVKLGASDRSGAVDRARELRVLTNRSPRQA